VGGALIFALFDYESRGTSHEAAQPYLVIGLILAILGTAMSSDTTQRYAYNPDDEEPTKQITPLSFELKWRIGARTAAFLVSALTKYSSKIELLGHGDNWGDAKRALDWMLLGELEAGSQIQLRVDGADASAAIERITQIFTGGTRQACCPHPECTSTPSLIECAGDMYLYACSNGHSW
jgi:phosphotransferase system HPr (HPr) family protein